MKTREEVEQLKSDWQFDPIWDIEHSVGFEDYKEELKEFRLEHENKVRKIFEKARHLRYMESSAFAIPAEYCPDGSLNNPGASGISRREYFTAMAMQALIPVVIDRGGAYLLSDDADNGYSVKDRLESISITAARIADATLNHLYNTQQ